MSSFGMSDVRDWVRSLTAPRPSGPSVTVEDICQNFYDGQLLSSGAGTDRREGFFDSFEQAIARADVAFAQLVDEDDFRTELTALRFELFGFALTRSLVWHREDICLRELVTTQRYLEQRDELRLWEGMGIYNNAIAEAALHSRKERRRKRGRRLSFRLSLAERWESKGVPHGCLARYANRCESDDAWDSGHALTALIQTLTGRLRIPLNARAQMQLQHLLYVFHDEPLQRLKQVRLI
jgi:hypothetical protein